MIDTDLTTAEIDHYHAAVERIKDRYAQRITAQLESVADAFRAMGWDVAGPYSMFGDDYQWNVCLRPDDIDDHSIDVSVEIAESLGYDGTCTGVNLGMHIVRWGGQVLGVLEPYNFTPSVWVDVDNEDDIDERFDFVLAPHIPAEAVDYILENA